MTSHEELHNAEATSPEPQISPLPFYAGLSRVLSGVTIALVLTYLEIHHPAPPSDSQSLTGRSSAPVYVDCDLMCERLGISRRTLHIALSCLAVWWRDESQRSGAARSGREFSNSSHSRYGKVKPYSLIGSRSLKANQTFTIHRNYGRINNILTLAAIDSWQEPAPLTRNTLTSESQLYATEQVADSLSDILDRAMRLKGRNGWDDERRASQSRIMKGIHAAKREMRKKS